MSRFEAVLVDLDGTLVDTSEVNYQAYANALLEVGVSIARAAFDRQAQGRNWKQFLPAMLADAGVARDPADIAKRKSVLYAGLIATARPNHALIGLLKMLKPLCRTALVTTASAVNAGAVLDTHDLRQLFDVVVTGDDVRRHKPDPEAYVLAAQRLSVAPGACLVIEDTDIGVASARAFGSAILKVEMQ